MKKIYLFLIFIGFGLMAFQNIKSDLFVVPIGWNAPVYDFSQNPLTKEKIALGRALFHDPLLSRNNTISCVSCHSQYNAFTHADHALSHGIEDRIGNRNSPTLMNLAWQDKFMWDGAIHNLDMQSLAPISHPDEMDENLPNLIRKLQESPLYPAAFYAAYGDSTITGERILKSFSQFLLTLVSANSKYDQVKNGKTIFTDQEKNGYAIFKKHCNSCHQEPLFTTNDFANNGLIVDDYLKDYGRMSITKKPVDSLKFKIPTLRNIQFSMPYMHDGRFKRLSEVINHYTTGIQHSPTLAEKLQNPIVLTSNEKVDLTAFLLTLTDKEFLFNRDFSFPRSFFFPKK